MYTLYINLSPIVLPLKIPNIITYCLNEIHILWFQRICWKIRNHPKMAGKLKDGSCVDAVTPSSSRNCVDTVETSNSNKMAQPTSNLDVNLNNRTEKSPSKHNEENKGGGKTIGLMSLNDNKVGVYILPFGKTLCFYFSIFQIFFFLQFFWR